MDRIYIRRKADGKIVFQKPATKKNAERIKFLLNRQCKAGCYVDSMEKGFWKDDKEFVLDLLHEAHVLVVHGSGFCSTYGKGHFRAVILPQVETLEKAFDKLEQFMKKKLSKIS